MRVFNPSAADKASVQALSRELADDGLRASVAALVSGAAVGTAAVVGGRSGPTPAHPQTAAWYAHLRKPSFTPSGPAFGVAWTALEGLLWFSGYRMLNAAPSPRRSVALGLWGLCLLGLAGFPWVLFGRKKLGGALGVTAVMLGSSAGFVGAAAPVDKAAALAGVPLVLWVSFASILQEELWRRNT
jgi:tryptophan-rich sensory protein